MFNRINVIPYSGLRTDKGKFQIIANDDNDRILGFRDELNRKRRSLLP